MANIEFFEPSGLPSYWFDDPDGLIVRLARRACRNAPAVEIDAAPDTIEPDPSDPMVQWVSARVRVRRDDLLGAETWVQAATRLCAAAPAAAICEEGFVWDLELDEIEHDDFSHPAAMVQCWVESGAPGLRS